MRGEDATRVGVQPPLTTVPEWGLEPPTPVYKTGALPGKLYRHVQLSVRVVAPVHVPHLLRHVVLVEERTEVPTLLCRPTVTRKVIDQC